VTLSERGGAIFGLVPGPSITWTELRELLHAEHRELARNAVEHALATHGVYVDGYELLRRVRALGEARGGKLTAFARSEDRTRALHAGFFVHLAKPIEPSELVATVASVLGRTAAQP